MRYCLRSRAGYASVLPCIEDILADPAVKTSLSNFAQQAAQRVMKQNSVKQMALRKLKLKHKCYVGSLERLPSRSKTGERAFGEERQEVDEHEHQEWSTSMRNVANKSGNLGSSTVQSSSASLCSESYAATTLALSSSEVDEEETCPSKAKKKKIPSWAIGDKLEMRYAFQLKKANADIIFAGACPPVKAKEVFGRRQELKRHSESAIWEAD